MATSKEINERNREFWTEQSQSFDGVVRNFPEAVVVAAEEMEREISIYGPLNIGSLESKSEAVLRVQQRLGPSIIKAAKSQEQSKFGANPRPGARSKIREATKRAMQVFLKENDDRTLNDFIEAAQNGSVENFRMSPPYVVIVDFPGDDSLEQEYKFRTLEGIWTEARK